MRRLLAICTAVGLLCGALGCHSCGDCGNCGGGRSCVHGRCDCDQGPLYGCHYEGMDHGHIMPTAAQATPVAEPLKAMPKDTMPPEDGK